MSQSSVKIDVYPIIPLQMVKTFSSECPEATEQGKTDVTTKKPDSDTAGNKANPKPNSTPNPKKIAIKYNTQLRRSSTMVFVVTILGFAVPFFRFMSEGKWYSNAIAAKVPHLPETQILLTIHAIFAMLWILMGLTQIFFGSLLIKHDSTWFGAKYHRLVGKFVLPPIIIIFSTTALIVLFEESAKDRMTLGTIILNIIACLFVVVWFILGLIFIFKKKYLKHKDCMSCVYVITFIPGCFRFIRWTFLLFHYFVNGEYCTDSNPMLYTLLTTLCTTGLIMFALWGRVNRKELHNVLFVVGFCFASLFPMFTMHFNLNPCDAVNLPNSTFGVVIG